MKERLKGLAELLVEPTENVSSLVRLRWYHVVGFLVVVLGVPVLMAIGVYSLERASGKVPNVENDLKFLVAFVIGMALLPGLAGLAKWCWRKLSSSNTVGKD